MGFEESLSEVLGVDYFVGEFMVLSGFPIVIKREHFKPIREFISRRMKVDTFEQAFYKICSKYPKSTHNSIS